MEQNNDRVLIRDALPAIGYKPLDDILDEFVRQVKDQHAGCVVTLVEFDLAAAVTGDKTSIIYLEDVIAKDAATSVYDPLREWAGVATDIKRKPETPPLFKTGDEVETVINRDLSGMYWSLQGTVLEIQRAYIAVRWKGQSYPARSGWQYVVEFKGPRFDAVRKADRDVCPKMTLPEKMLKAFEVAVPLDGRPIKTDAQVVADTELMADLITRIVHGRARTDESKLYRESSDPRCKSAWTTACQIQEEVFQTDVENALSEQE